MESIIFGVSLGCFCLLAVIFIGLSALWSRLNDIAMGLIALCDILAEEDEDEE